jgi:hypothetical protein
MELTLRPGRHEIIERQDPVHEWRVPRLARLRFTLASVTTDVLAFLAAAVAGFFAHHAAGRTRAERPGRGGRCGRAGRGG